MLHYRTGVHAIASQYPKVSPYTMIVFESSDLPAMIKTLKQHGVKILSSNHDIAVFEDPFGNVSEVRQGALHEKSFSLRSRHKAWGARPRMEHKKQAGAREDGRRPEISSLSPAVAGSDSLLVR
jgi:hypothetical protein